MIYFKNCLYIYTDGSSYSKPRKGGIGIQYRYLDDQEVEHRIPIDSFGYEGATNNQMELKAVIEGLRQISSTLIPINYNRIEVRTDSCYVVDNRSNAIYNWSKNNWLNSSGRPIENAQLWKELIKVLLATKCRVEFKWVKGHAKDMDNKAVDKLAKQSAKGYLHAPMNVVKLRRKQSEKATKVGSIEMKGQRVLIHVINDEYLPLQKLSKYRYEIVSKSSKFYMNVDIIFSELHHLKSGHTYRITTNKDTKNPRIMKLIEEVPNQNTAKYQLAAIKNKQ